MSTLLITIIISLFVAVLFVNIYFRVKVLKTYKKLVKNRVDFGTTHFFDKEKLESEVLTKYPEHREDILTFVNNIRFSMKCASILIVLITAFGAVLMWYRHE